MENGVVDVTINPQRPFNKNLIVILIGSNEALQKLKRNREYDYKYKQIHKSKNLIAVTKKVR